MLKFLVLGLIQGLTEFLPVSSSAHLVIVQELFKIKENQLLIDIILHVGTLFAVLVFFSKDISFLTKNFFQSLFLSFKKRSFKFAWLQDANFRLAVYIMLVTGITGVVAIVGKDFFESLFKSLHAVSFALLITAAILIQTRKFVKGYRTFKEMKIIDSVFLGFAQALAIVPGISRSGATMAALLFRKFDREEAFRISFLASIPAILGAFVLESKSIGDIKAIPDFKYILAGFLIAFLTGIIALKILQNILKKTSLAPFGYYCLIVALLTILI